MRDRPINGSRALFTAVVPALAFTLALGGIAGGAPKAVAPKCPERTLCVWKHDNFAGKRVKIDERGISNKLAQEMNNEASSFYNRRGKTATLFAGRNGNGASLCYPPQYENTSLAFDSFGDRASSTRLSRKQTVCPP